MKKIISIILAVTMLLGICVIPASAAGGDAPSYVMYSKSDRKDALKSWKNTSGNYADWQAFMQDRIDTAATDSELLEAEKEVLYVNGYLIDELFKYVNWEDLSVFKEYSLLGVATNLFTLLYDMYNSVATQISVYDYDLSTAFENLLGDGTYNFYASAKALSSIKGAFLISSTKLFSPEELNRLFPCIDTNKAASRRNAWLKDHANDTLVGWADRYFLTDDNDYIRDTLTAEDQEDFLYDILYLIPLLLNERIKDLYYTDSNEKCECVTDHLVPLIAEFSQLQESAKAGDMDTVYEMLPLIAESFIAMINDCFDEVGASAFECPAMEECYKSVRYAAETNLFNVRTILSNLFFTMNKFAYKIAGFFAK